MYIAVLILILVLTAIFFINIKIKLHFCLALSELKSTFLIAGIEIKKSSKSNKKVKIYYNIVKYIAEHIRAQYFKLYILLGLGDPIADVFAVQFLRNIVGATYSLFNKAFTKRTELYVNIMPAFNQTTLNANFDCIINVRVGYIIIAYIRHYNNKLKNKLRSKFK